MFGVFTSVQKLYYELYHIILDLEKEYDAVALSLLAKDFRFAPLLNDQKPLACKDVFLYKEY